MKNPRTFTQRWNPTALRRILRDYRKGTSNFICHCSPEFYDLWVSHKLEIKKLAAAANIPDCRVETAKGCSVLFLPTVVYNKESDTDEWCANSRNHRIAFLKSEINRLTKQA